MVSVFALDLAPLVCQDRDGSVLSLGVLIIDDNARRPPKSVTDSSLMWKGMPSLCRHAPAYAKKLKKQTSCRWSGGDGDGSSSDAQNHPSSLLDAPASPTKLQQNNASLRKPNRKASLDMMSHHLYDKYNCPVKKPMRKASVDMSASDLNAFRNCNKPMRKASVDMCGAKPMRKASMGMGGVFRPMRKASLDMCWSTNSTIQPMPCCHNCQKMHAPGMHTCQQRRSMSLLNLLFRRNGQRQPKTGTCQM